MANITAPLQEQRVTTTDDGAERALAVKSLSPQNVQFAATPNVNIANTPTVILQTSIPDATELLASASRNATTASADQTNSNYKGVLLWLNVTVAPGVQTLNPTIEAKDPVSGLYAVVCQPAAPFTATGLYLLSVYPSAGNLLAGLTAFFSNTVFLPKTWRLRIVHSGAGSWTYSAALQYLP